MHALHMSSCQIGQRRRESIQRSRALSCGAESSAAGTGTTWAYALLALAHGGLALTAIGAPCEVRMQNLRGRRAQGRCKHVTGGTVKGFAIGSGSSARSFVREGLGSLWSLHLCGAHMQTASAFLCRSHLSSHMCMLPLATSQALPAAVVTKTGDQNRDGEQTVLGGSYSMRHAL